MNDFRSLILRLATDVDQNIPLDLTDDELRLLASLATQELCSRMPLDAVRRGDLPPSYESAARERARMRQAVQEACIFAPTTRKQPRKGTSR